MRSRSLLVAGAALLVFPLMAEKAEAFDFHRSPHHSKPLVCYQKVHTPPVYGTVSRRVMVKNGWYENRSKPRSMKPAVYGSRSHRVQTRLALTG